MAYLSLYRKHRPRTFSEVVGQEHVTRTLINAITEDRLHHAYLFTGQRGTGKTSTARILAAAVNCEAGPTPTPCGECEQCTSIVAGRNVDVVELDMASHGGVDDARELRDRAVFAPAAGRRKVYILDEVHMASTAAFNALLKVVEEPPPHVLFAMATTDPQKVLPTIMSRVQRLDLRRVSAPDLTAHLRRLGEIEGFTIDDEAAAGVVAAGDGSVRDTLSVMEQVLAFAADAGARVDGVLAIEAQHVTRVLGATPFELVVTIVDSIADGDVAGALTGVQHLLDGGHDLRRFTLDLARHLRDLLVLAAAPHVEGLVDATAERRDRLATQAQRFGTDTLVRAVELVGEVLVEQRQGPPRLPLELAVARLATPGADGDLLALADRVARLEKAVAGGDGGTVPAPAAGPAPAAAPAPVAPAVRAAAPAAAPGAPAPADAPAEQAAAIDAPAGTDAPAAASTGTDDGATQGTESAAGGATEEAAAGDAPAGTAQDTAAPSADDAVGDDSVADASADTAAAEDDGAAAATETSVDDDAAAPPVDAAPTAAPTDAAPAAAGADDGADGTDADTDPADDAATDEDVAARAAALAADAAATGPRPPATDLADRPGTTTVERDLPDPAPSGGDDLALIADRWDTVVERVGEESRRAKAFYEPATPVRLGNGVLLLSYPASRRFHAEQGKSGEMAGHLANAIEQVAGLARIRVDVSIDEEGPRAPSPAPMAARDPDDGPSAAEVAAVTEVEHAPDPAASVDVKAVDELLRSELGAERLPDDE